MCSYIIENCLDLYAFMYIVHLYVPGYLNTIILEP